MSGVNLVSLETISKLLMLTERRVQQLAKEGHVPKAERGKYEIVGSVQGYIRYLRKIADEGEPGRTDYGAERTRLVKSRADLAEMEAERARGSLVPVEEVESAWADIISTVRSHLLGIPAQAAPILYEKTSIEEINQCLKELIHLALSELAGAEVESLPSGAEPWSPDDGPERPEGVRAAAEPHD